MLPHERSLVEEMKDQPFALLGINSDGDAAKLRGILDKEGLSQFANWRHWVDGSTDGPKILAVQAVNASGTRGNAALLGITDIAQYPAQFSIFLDVTPPSAPTAPDLQDASDRGVSSTDNITNAVVP